SGLKENLTRLTQVLGKLRLLPGVLATPARARPEDVAFIDGTDGRTLTWRSVAAHAERWQRAVATGEIVPCSRVGLVTGGPLEFTAAYLGCLSAGLTVVPIDPRLTPAELTSALARLRVDVVATDDFASTRPELSAWCTGIDGPEPLWNKRAR